MPAYRYGRGISRSFAHSIANGRFRMRRTTIAMKKLASSAQTRSGARSNSRGPGCRPYWRKAASMIAAVAEIGRPRARRAPIAMPVVELPAASGAARPRMAPLPNMGFLRRLSRRFSRP